MSTYAVYIDIQHTIYSVVFWLAILPDDERFLVISYHSLIGLA